MLRRERKVSPDYFLRLTYVLKYCKYVGLNRILGLISPDFLFPLFNMATRTSSITHVAHMCNSHTFLLDSPGTSTCRTHFLSTQRPPLPPVQPVPLNTQASSPHCDPQTRSSLQRLQPTRHLRSNPCTSTYYTGKTRSYSVPFPHHRTGSHTYCRVEVHV